MSEESDPVAGDADVTLIVEDEGFEWRYDLGDEEQLEDLFDEYGDALSAGVLDYRLAVDGFELSIDDTAYAIEDPDDLVPRDLYERLVGKYRDALDDVDEVEDELEDTKRKNTALRRKWLDAREEKQDLQKELLQLKNKIQNQQSKQGGGKQKQQGRKKSKDSSAFEVKDVSDVTFDDIGGLDDQIDTLIRKIDLQSEYPQIYDNLEDISVAKKSGGTLLHGPPGTGKTMAMKAMANEHDYDLLVVNGPELMNKYVGESEKMVREIVDRAEEQAPAIVLIDEFDSIAPRRDANSSTKVTERIVNQMLASVDGVKESEQVYWVAATNRKDMIDPALLRPGRFGTHIAFPRPDEEATYDIASKYMPDDVAAYVTDQITSLEGWEHINNGARVHAIAEEAVNEFLTADKEQDGAYLREIAEEVTEAYEEGEETYIDVDSGQLSRSVNGQIEPDYAEMVDAIQEQVRENLFSETEHLALIPDEFYDAAVEDVYGDDADPHATPDTPGFQ